MTVIHKSSGALQPGVDLPEGGVDVIVTELVDSGLLGEKIIPVLTDARARGLLARGGRVVPEVQNTDADRTALSVYALSFLSSADRCFVWSATGATSLDAEKPHLAFQK